MSLSNILSCKNLLLIFLFFSSIFFLEFLFFLVLLTWMICKIFFPVIQLWTWVTQVDLLHRFGLNLCICTVKSPIICSSWSYFSINSLKSCWEASKFPFNMQQSFSSYLGLDIHGGIYIHKEFDVDAAGGTFPSSTAAWSNMSCDAHTSGSLLYGFWETHLFQIWPRMMVKASFVKGYLC